MELKAVCSQSAMTARIAICSVGRGDSVTEDSASPLELDKVDSLDKGRPRDLGGGVEKVWYVCADMRRRRVGFGVEGMVS